MTALEKVLPPSNVIENSDASSSATTQGFLEIEVSRIYFVTAAAAAEKRVTDNPTPTFVTYTYKNNKNNKNKKRHQRSIVESSSTTPTKATAKLKLIWTGENRDVAASIRIISSKDGDSNRKKNRENNKIRYQIRSSPALFLDYLRSCEPLEIVVSSNDSGAADTLSQALVRLPPVLLRKYAANYARRCSFEHKTKIYALYNQSDDDKHHHQQQHQRRSGEIQLLFRMLFAPLTLSAKHAATAASITRSSAVLLQDRLLTSSLHDPKEAAVVVAAAAAAQGEKFARVPTKSAEEIVEAMKKLDAKLVAYLAGDRTDDQQEQQLEREVDIMTPKKMKSSLSPSSPKSSLGSRNASSAVSAEIVGQEERIRAQLFRHISAVRLQMEALTLQPSGTKRMELLQSEIRPIFTVECQLSHELIAGVVRSDMFHIMQFESEKFQSLTQCTRFGQEAQRDVRLPVVVEEKEMLNETATNFGRIHFTVWWREPGTCLNEMLGMGVLELAELYNASLLEQCKCIAIQRRGVHLASLYFKISLLSAVMNAPAGVGAAAAAGELQLLLDQSSLKNQCNDAGDEKNKQQTASTPHLLQNAAAQSCGGSGGGIGNGNASSAEANSDRSNNNNKNHELASSNFSAETSKVRLLKGFVYASETRNFEMARETTTTGGEDDYFLVCRRFWQDEEAAAVVADADNSFNYQEQFALLNDEKFVSRVDKQHLQLEIWSRRVEVKVDDDGNTLSSSQQPMVPLGTVRLPLHQFFIAYRDAVITNHLCKGKLPVISIDAWVPIVSCQSDHNQHPPTQLGELKCLLAIGSEEQILNLKTARGFTSSTGGSAALATLFTGGSALLFPAEQIKTNFAENLNNQQKPPQAVRQTSDLLDMLQRALMTPTEVPRLPPAVSAGEPPSSPSSIASPFKPLQPPNVKSFKFALDIQRGFGLPLNPAAKSCKKQAASSAVASKRNANAAAASKRYPPNEAPSTYVTFQADAGHGKLYKSHEGAVYATDVYDKSTQPQWQQRFRVAISVEYLTNPQKHFILKVWKKATSATDSALQGRPIQPTPMDDSIIGFAALDLSALLRGMHIGGAFTIVDFNGRPNGQLEVRCQPLEDLRKILQTPPPLPSARVPLPTAAAASAAITASSAAAAQAASMGNMDAVIDQFESSLDLSHLNLGHAIKRKFSELEVISQRLRTRLLDVTGDDAQFAATPLQFNAAVFDNWRPLDDNQDEAEDEFERDISTPPPQSPVLDTAAASQEEDVEENKKEEATKMISAETPSSHFVGAATADCPKE